MGNFSAGDSHDLRITKSKAAGVIQVLTALLPVLADTPERLAATKAVLKQLASKSGSLDQQVVGTAQVASEMLRQIGD